MFPVLSSGTDISMHVTEKCTNDDTLVCQGRTNEFLSSQNDYA